jgi:hypothetical protein
MNMLHPRSDGLDAAEVLRALGRHVEPLDPLVAGAVVYEHLVPEARRAVDYIIDAASPESRRHASELLGAARRRMEPSVPSLPAA